MAVALGRASLFAGETCLVCFARSTWLQAAEAEAKKAARAAKKKARPHR